MLRSIKNLSKTLGYLSQRKNKKRPAASCNVTVATMAAEISGFSIGTINGMSGPDYVMSLLESKEAWSLLDKYVPGRGCNPWNVSYCIAWAINKAVGKRFCRVEEVTLEDMLVHISQNKGAIGVGGGFTSKVPATAGHFVCVVGYVIDEDEAEYPININKITHVIVDDPWGNYLKKYSDSNGDDIEIPVETFKKLVFGKSPTKKVQMYYQSEVA